jgi:hypothetical protein
MYRTITLFIITAFFSLSAQAITIDPANCGTTSASLTCWTTTENRNLGSSAAIETAFGVSFDTDLTLYYKDEVGGSEFGTFASSYSTSYANSANEPADADITYGSGASISCPECYLLVKDGNNDPAQYLIRLSGWNGTDMLELRNFWIGVQGGISHVQILGNVSPVPVPAAFWLFGTALIGFIGFSSRTKV